MASQASGTENENRDGSQEADHPINNEEGDLQEAGGDADDQLSLAMQMSIEEAQKKEQREMEEEQRDIEEALRQFQALEFQTNNVSDDLQPEGTMPMATGSTAMESGLSSLDVESISDEDYQKWLASRKGYNLVEPDRADLQEIKADFDKAGIKMTRVRKVQNPSLLKQFEIQGFQMQERKPKGFDLNVKTLYHGTDVKEKILSMEGLDDRVAKKGHFGTGIYFSDNPKKCVQYISRRGSARPAHCSPEPYILRCRVLLGDVKEYPDGHTDLNLMKEPVRAVTESGNIYYDSVKGMPNRDGLYEYVIYERRSVQIEHIINYDPHAPPDNQNFVSAPQSSQTALEASGGSVTTETVTSGSVTLGSVTSGSVTLGSMTLDSAPSVSAASEPVTSIPSVALTQNEDAFTLDIVGGDDHNDALEAAAARPLPPSPSSSEGHNDLDLDTDSVDPANSGPNVPNVENVLPGGVEDVQTHSGSGEDSPVENENTGGNPEMRQYLLGVREKLQSGTFVAGDEDTNKKLLKAFYTTYQQTQFRDIVTENDSAASRDQVASQDTQSNSRDFNDHVDGAALTGDETETSNPSAVLRGTATVVEEGDCIEEVMKSLVAEFQVVFQAVDFQEARTYIELAGMDLDGAINMYIFDNLDT